MILSPTQRLVAGVIYDEATDLYARHPTLAWPAPRVIVAQAFQESGFDCHAVGDSGLALGCFQFHRPAWEDVMAAMDSLANWRGIVPVKPYDGGGPVDPADACIAAICYLRIKRMEVAREWKIPLELWDSMDAWPALVAYNWDLDKFLAACPNEVTFEVARPFMPDTTAAYCQNIYQYANELESLLEGSDDTGGDNA